MKFAFAVLALIATTVEASKLDREIYSKSLNTDDDEGYQLSEQWDKEKEIRDAEKTME